MIRKQVQFLGILLAISLAISGILIWFFERPFNDEITSIGDVLWWWIVTSTTVGYGDISPATTMGRVGGVVTMLTGIYCYTVIISVVNDEVREFLNRSRLGTAQVTSTDHIVICEYTAFADELIQAFPKYPALANRRVVVITELVEVNPYDHISFVRGVPINPASLEKANIEEAAYIFVFSNARFAKPDLKTLHVTSRIQKFNTKARIFVELENPDTELKDRLSRGITALGTTELLATVIGDNGIDLSEHFDSQEN